MATRNARTAAATATTQTTSKRRMRGTLSTVKKADVVPAAATAQTPAAEKKSKGTFFTATVTPASIEIKTSQNGTRYATMKGATVKTAKRGENTRTVMAFGNALSSIEHKLAEGQPIGLALVTDGGTLNVVGIRWTDEERGARKAQRQAA